MSILVQPRGLLLDLDGTLIDSAPDLAGALAVVLQSHGRTPLGENVVRSLVGHGVAKLVEGAFAHTGEALAGDDLKAAVSRMADEYGKRLTDRTRLLPGVGQLIAQCEAQGIALACVTNKPQAMATTILESFGLTRYIDVIVGGDGDRPRKPAPDPLLHAVEVLGLSIEDVWMVGDGLPDMQAARAANIQAIAVASDYGDPFDAESEALLAVSGLPALCKVLHFLGVMAA